MLPDDIIDAKVPCLKQMIDVFDQTQSTILATQVVEGPAISSYGVLDCNPVKEAAPLRREGPGREAEAGGRAFEKRHYRSLHPHPQDLRSARADAARRGR